MFSQVTTIQSLSDFAPTFWEEFQVMTLIFTH